jgi:hypothetical protein
VVKADGFDQRDWMRMLLISEADESYIAYAKRMLTDETAEVTDSWVGRRSWAIDAAFWLETLETLRYRFRVMIANTDGTFTLHSEDEALDFVVDPPHRRSVRLEPGVLHAGLWLRPLLGGAGPRRYVLLERELWGLKWTRPARIVKRQGKLTPKRQNF